MVEQTIRVGMPLSEFMDEYNKAPFELAEGRIFPLSPNVLGHQLVVKTLFRLLDAHVAAHAAFNLHQLAQGYTGP